MSTLPNKVCKYATDVYCLTIIVLDGNTTISGHTTKSVTYKIQVGNFERLPIKNDEKMNGRCRQDNQADTPHLRAPIKEYKKDRAAGNWTIAVAIRRRPKDERNTDRWQNLETGEKFRKRRRRENVSNVPTTLRALGAHSGDVFRFRGRPTFFGTANNYRHVLQPPPFISVGFSGRTSHVSDSTAE